LKEHAHKKRGGARVQIPGAGVGVGATGEGSIIEKKEKESYFGVQAWRPFFKGYVWIWCG
jgi:hypothetical protein